MKRMKKSMGNACMLLLLLIVAGSCKKSFLELDPPSTIVESNFFKTQLEADQALTAVYKVLQWGNINYGHTPMMGWTEAASDDAYSGGGSSSDAVGVKALDQLRTVTTSDGTYQSVWMIYFQGVARANVFLSVIGGINASNDYKNETSAEAKFLRAQYYFDLVRWFENVQLFTTPVTELAQINQPQAPPQDVLNQIAKDLVEAMQYLPKASMKANNGHVTYWSAEALLARVYLYCHGVYGTDLNAGGTIIDAAKTRANLDEIINNGGFDLIPVYADIWRKTNEMGIESVWEVDYSSLAQLTGSTSNQYQAQGNYNVLYFGPRGVSGTYYPGFSNAIPTESLYQEFETTPMVDPRRAATILELNTKDIGGPGFIRGWQHTGYFNNKYNTSSEYKTGAGLVDINWGQNIHAIRFADVLLMASELYIGVNQTKADQYLNRVRTRAGMPARTATIDNLRHERRVELAGEGIRYWDLLRYGLPYAKQMIDASSLRGPNYNGGKNDAGMVTATNGVPLTTGANTPDAAYKMDWDPSKRGHIPIPASQITLSNGVLQQNPGYN